MFFVEEDIRRILREESKLKYNENLETFRKLLFDGKIDVIHDWQMFIPSFYNIS